ESRSVLLEVTLLLECRVSLGVGRPLGSVDGEVRLREHGTERRSQQLVAFERVERLRLRRRQRRDAAPLPLRRRERRRVDRERLRRLEATLDPVETGGDEA